MSYRERRRAASFRGVPFEVEDRERQGGRRGETHEFAQRDEPDADDTGRKARTFRVQAYVHGVDYDLDLTRLLAALERPGPGLYVDPWQGEHRVVARSFSARESSREQGRAWVTIDFEEAGGQRYPEAASDTRGALVLNADNLAARSVDAFGKAFDATGPGFVAADAQLAAGEPLGVLDETLGGFEGVSAASALDTAESVLTAADVAISVTATAQDALASLRGGFPGSLRAGADFGSELASVFQMVADAGLAGGQPDSVATGFALMDGVDGASLPAVPLVTETRRRISGNRDQLFRLAGRLGVAQEARAVGRMTFDSVESALSIGNALTGRIDRQMAVTGEGFDDGVFEALGGLRAAVVDDVRARSAALPRLRQTSFGRALPSAVVAHKLMGDARRVDELLALNGGVKHPGFVEPIADVSYLTD